LEGPIAPRGFEQSPFKPPKTPISQNEHAESGAPDGEKPPVAPDLTKVIAAWPQLPVVVCAAILTLGKAAADGNSE